MFRNGDVVRLKSGGPKMTVQKCVELGVHDTHGSESGPWEITCIWFDDKGNSNKAVFRDTDVVETK